MSCSSYSKLAVLSCLLSLMLLSGCATIVKGTTQKIPIASDPSNAEVTVDGQSFGETPIDIEMKRKRDHLVTISKHGYKSRSIPIVKSVGGAVWGNVIAGGLIGWGIDATSGAQYNLSPSSISVSLAPLSAGENSDSSNESVSQFVKELNSLDELKAKKKITDDQYNTMRTDLFKKYYPDMDLKGMGISTQSDAKGAQATEAKPPGDEK